MSDNDELLPDFLAESADNIERVNSALDQLLSSSDRPALMDGICRGVHTVKGGSSMFDFHRTKSVAHSLETYLTQLKSDTGRINESVIVFVRAEVQKLESLLKARDQLEVDVGVPPGTDSTASTSSGPPIVMPITATPTPLGAVSAVSNPGSSTNSLSPSNSGSPSTDEFIRVPVQRINEAMNAIGETFLIRNQMVYLVENLRLGTQDSRDFFQAWDALDNSLRRSISELERSTMSMRMMSMQGVFSRMARVVQTYTSTHSKKIRFQTEGEQTELDKKVLDALGDPLIHLIRNAMDHGIESPEQRVAAGKAESGTIRLTANIVGNEAIIEIKDDGKGMDPKKILASAKSKGIDVSHITDDRSAIEVIFLPGFSTAEKVSDVSGRGVGMDAVQSSVQALGGSVQIDTQFGIGSTFAIKIPVSMSMIPVVLVNINGHKYAIPNRDILETRQTTFDQIICNAGNEYVTFRGSAIQCVDLRKKILISEPHHEENIRECSVIFFNSAGRYLAVRVSSLDKTTEIISKPLSSIAPKTSWLTGTSVLPTGEAIFVISLARLCTDVVEPVGGNLHAS